MEYTEESVKKLTTRILKDILFYIDTKDVWDREDHLTWSIVANEISIRERKEEEEK